MVPQYLPDRLNKERYNMAANSGSLLLNHDIPPAALPAHAFGQEWRNPLRSLGQVPLDPTPAVLDESPYMGYEDIQFTQVSRVPGPVDNSLTWGRPINPSCHLDYLAGCIRLLLIFSYSLIMGSVSHPSSKVR